MQIELSLKESQDIYEDLGAAVMDDSRAIKSMKKNNTEIYNGMLHGFEARQERRMTLINKIGKLAGYQEN